MHTLNGLQRFSKLILAAISLLTLVTTSPIVFSQAKNWPDKPIKLIVGFPPGGGSDAVARIMACLLYTSPSPRD